MAVIDARFAQMIREDRPLLGMFSGFNAPAVIELAGYAGFDFVIIDNEHGPASISETENQIRAAKCANVPPIVRVSGANTQEILRTLDVGASGVQVPQVNTKEQMESVIQAAKYPPFGQRGVAFSTRAAGWGVFGGPAYLKSANVETVVVTHLETGEAVKNIDAMLAVKGLDVMFIGPNDLSVSMGYEGNYNHPDMQKVIAECLGKIRAAGVVPGILAVNADDYKKYASLGARYMPCTANGLLLGAMRGLINGCKA